jgi:adenosylmethionine-8-amino-7-oxononanoate aminotransferase
MTEETRLWHPFADMGAVRTKELVIERGEDVWVFDTEGRRYLDATASLWYANVGHGREEIARAVAEQMTQLEAYNSFGDFVTEPARRLAARLASHAPMHGDARVFLTSGGGDSIDLAAKLSRRYWQEAGEPNRTRFIVRREGYHGTHGYGTALAGIQANRVGWGPLDEDVSIVPHDSLDALRDEVARLGPESVAAIFCEPVIGAGGVYPPADGYIEGLAELCRETGILFVCDSVICGFGRLGTWYGIERWGVEPDLITFAKGVTSGYLPLGGVVVSQRVAEPFFGAPGGPMLRHGATYSAHASCCAAAMANLDILESEGLMTRGQELEGDLIDALSPLADHELVAEVRGGTGLLAAVELSAELRDEVPGAVAALTAKCRARGVIVRGLLAGIAASPPLTATADHFELITEAVSTSLDELARERPGAVV